MKEITPVWQLKKKKKKRFQLKADCHIDLKRKRKNSSNVFCSVKKKVNGDDIFIFGHKAQVCGEGTPVPSSDLADSAI